MQASYRYGTFVLGVLTIGALVAGPLAFADSGRGRGGDDDDRDDRGRAERSRSDDGDRSRGRGQDDISRNEVYGQVTAVGATTITINARLSSNATSTFTVDAANAEVKKVGAGKSGKGVAAKLSDITVGSYVKVHGTVNGTTITAREVSFGMPEAGFFKDKKREDRDDRKSATSTRPASIAIVGNGQPVLAGKVTAVSGTIVSIANNGATTTTYTIDATNAKIVKAGATTTVSQVVVGDMIVAQGSVSGTTMAATSIIDKGMVSNPKGFLGGMLKRVFGF